MPGDETLEGASEKLNILYKMYVKKSIFSSKLSFTISNQTLRYFQRTYLLKGYETWPIQLHIHLEEFAEILDGGLLILLLWIHAFKVLELRTFL